MEQHDTPGHDPEQGQRSLTASGSRHPAWERLPEEPPFDLDGRYEMMAVPQPAAGTGPSPTAPSPSRPGRRGTWWQIILAGVLGAVLAVGGLQILDSDDPQPSSTADAAPIIISGPGTTQAEPEAADSVAPPAADTPDAARIGEEVIPSIVTVQVLQNGAAFASGSGVVYGDGYVITNDHVIADGTAYEVVLSDGRTSYQAELVGTDPLTDLAVLQVDAPGLAAIELGTTTSLRVGDAAVAVGSPLGLEGGPSLTVGVVSAFDRIVTVGQGETLYGMLQTDAPITQGSSGGALVDAAGRLIGITTAVGVSDVGIEGIGFATPVELVDRVVTEIIDTGSVAHALLGITGDTSFTDETSGASVAAGVNVATVEPGSAALDAGLAAGELIVAIEGREVTTMEDLIVALRYLSAGDMVTLTVADDSGAERVVEVTLGLRN